MSDRKRAVFIACASRTVRARRTPATSRVIVASAMAGLPTSPKLAASRTAMPTSAPKAGSANPALRSVPGYSTSAGISHTAMASSVSDTGQAAPLLM